MKRLIVTITVLLVIGIVSGVVIVAVGTRYANKIKNTPAPVATISVTESNKKLEAVQKLADDRYNNLRTLYTSQTTECLKGVTAYGKLTASLKVQTAAPTCGPYLTD